jgi:acetyl esterase/lipase
MLAPAAGLIGLLMNLAAASPSPAVETVPLRPTPAKAPPEQVVERGKDGVMDRAVSQVSEPSVTVYLPKPGTATGRAVVICPGGGYKHLALDKEGHDVGRWLAGIGVAGVVLKYRLPGPIENGGSLTLGKTADAIRVALDDVTRAVEIVRGNANRWNLRRDAVGVLGFSAGGHLALMLALTAGPAARPDFLVLAYPGVPKAPDALAKLADFPPTFTVHADDDKLSAGDNSARLYQALRAVKAPAELHVFASGGHGFGLRKTGKASDAWPTLLTAWLGSLDSAEAPEPPKAAAAAR